MAERLYSYVGPDAVRRAAAFEPAGRALETRAQLEAWLAEHPEAYTEGATFVVDPAGALRLAPRRSEHVACADGGRVRAAGEVWFARLRGRGPAAGLAVVEVSNQSTGFCPEPDASFPPLARALDALGVGHPGAYTTACVFRRCAACGQINLVKDAWLVCGACDAPLPVAWNFGD